MNEYLTVAGDEIGAEDEEFGAEEEFGAVAKRRVLKPLGETIYGLQTLAVAAGATAIATAQPQRRNRLKKLSIDQTLAANFLIASLVVGVEPVLSTQGAIPASVFASNSTAPSFRSVICEVGTTVTATVTNIDAAAQDFYAAAIADELPYRR